MDQSATNRSILGLAEMLFAEEGVGRAAFEEPATKDRQGTSTIQCAFQAGTEEFRTALNQFAEEFRAVQGTTRASVSDPTTWILCLLREMTGVVQRHVGLLHLMTIGSFEAGTESAGLFCSQVQELLPQITSKLRNAIPLIEQDREIAAIFGPAVVCLMASHSLFKPLLEEMGAGPFETSFYRKYPEVIADLAMTGIIAVVFNAKLGKYGPCDVNDDNMQ
jgi:hypothetical protein